MLNNYNLANLTTYKIGGPAKYFAKCNNEQKLLGLLSLFGELNINWFVIGNGSNILIADKGFPGAVIKLGRDFKKVAFCVNSVEVGSAVLLPVLSRHFLSKGWGGYEFMCDIPGTVGGAVRMNAGTKDGEIKDHFLSAKLLSPDGNITDVNKGDMNFSYRYSRLKETRDIVLSVKFELSFIDNFENIKNKINEIISTRNKKYPKVKKNCGSIFKKPRTGIPAGWYIEQVGLKGTAVGEAMVSNEHANWIVNTGHARADHVKYLIRKIQDEVFNKFNILLEREVIFIPEDL